MALLKNAAARKAGPAAPQICVVAFLLTLPEDPEAWP
jgi:hypothetical protein